MSNVLLIGDIHLPYTHKRYLSFCKSVYKKNKCNSVVFMGDIADNHAMSYHESDPELSSAGDELQKVKMMIKPWLRAFPQAKVCVGNHDKLPYRKAKSAGIAHESMKNYAEIYGTPSWDWQNSHTIDDVLYVHGKGSGINACYNAAIKKRQSLAMAHLHSKCGVSYHASHIDRIFALTVGCGIDIKSRAYSYGDDFDDRPILSCATILDGWFPQVHPMRLGE